MSVSVLTNAFPAVRASQAIGLAYGIAGLGNAAGALVGGLLTETVGWRAIFWLNVPLTVIALAIGALSITESSDTTVPRRIEVTGLALLTVGIGLFTLTFDRAPMWGWLSAWTVAAFAGSILIMATFVVIENRVRWPLVDLSLVRNPRFTVWWSQGRSPTSLTASRSSGRHVSAAGARTRPADRRARVSGAIGRCRSRRPSVRKAGRATTAGVGDGPDECHRGSVTDRTGGVEQLGPLPAGPDGMWIHHGSGLCLHDRGDAGCGGAGTGR